MKGMKKIIKKMKITNDSIKNKKDEIKTKKMKGTKRK
jgi:hypothetical protein